MQESGAGVAQDDEPHAAQDTPRKQPGQGLGHRKSDGLLLHVRTGAILLGDSEKKACALVARRLEQWINERAGCSLREVSENLCAGWLCNEWRRWENGSRRFRPAWRRPQTSSIAD